MAVEDADAVVDRLFELAVLLTDLMNGRLAASGLTPARGEVVWVLHHRGRLTQRELSEILGCTPRNVTGLVDALEDAGFVERGRHPTDRRAILLSLTGRGKRLAARWGADRDVGTTRLLAGTSRADLATFATVLDRVLTGLRDTPSPVQPAGGASK